MMTQKSMKCVSATCLRTMSTRINMDSRMNPTTQTTYRRCHSLSFTSSSKRSRTGSSRCTSGRTITVTAATTASARGHRSKSCRVGSCRFNRNQVSVRRWGSGRSHDGCMGRSRTWRYGAQQEVRRHCRTPGGRQL